eukprot:s1840_g10.t2
MGAQGWRIFVAAAAHLVAADRIQLFGPENASLPFPTWSGGLDLLSTDPPIFLLRGFVSSGEAERLLRDYEVELIPEFVRHVNDTSSPAFQRCMRRFPSSFCESTPAAGDHCDFQSDRRVFASQAMVNVHERIASTVGVLEDQVEEAWLFNWDTSRRGQDLHMDTYHHFQFPVRIATVLVRLRDDPVGVAFPLAKWPAAHALAEDETLIKKLSHEGNELPWRGSGTGRNFKSLGFLDEALAEVCRKAPLRLRQKTQGAGGDALLYYHLLGDSKVNMRSIHASCTTESADSPKIFMAKFVRGGSLLGPYGSLRTPPVPSELRAWMDWRQERSGLDTAAVWIDGTDHGLLDPSACRQHKKPWFVRPASIAGGPPVLSCGEPAETEYVKRRPGEAFEVHIVIANTGSRPWPPGTVLSLRDGHTMGGPAGLRLQEVPVGSTVPIALQLRAPEEPGAKAYSIWSLADGERVPFGALLWIDAAVVGNEEDISLVPDDSKRLDFASSPTAGLTGGGPAVGPPEVKLQEDAAREEAEEACHEQFWTDPIFQELSSQTASLPSVVAPDRGNPRLCWSLGHRFWFGELSFHHVAPPKTFVFGFCLPRRCSSDRRSEVDAKIAKPFLRRLFASSSGSDWCRLELSEWTQDLELPLSQALLTLLPPMLAGSLCGLGLLDCSVGGVQASEPTVSWQPAALRLMATLCLVVFHLASFPIYASGLPPGLKNFCTWACGMLHDPVFAGLSAALLLRGGWDSWKLQALGQRLGRKWLRLAPAGLSSRALLCGGLRRIPVAPFLLGIQPRLDDRLCSWTAGEAARRCTHHVCTPLFGVKDALLAFPPLDFAGSFVEQDMVRSAALVLLLSGLGSSFRLLRAAAWLGLLAWFFVVTRSLEQCLDEQGRIDGPCVPSPVTPYLDLPGDSVVVAAVVLWARLSPSPAKNAFPVGVSVTGIAVAVGMEVQGAPRQVGKLPWYLLSHLMLGFSLAAFCTCRASRAPAPKWLFMLDRLCFGVCAVHVRVLELVFGFLRPKHAEFSWDLFLTDTLVILLGSFCLSGLLYLYIRSLEVLIVSTARFGWAACTAAARRRPEN